MAKVIEKSKKKNSLPTLIGAGVMIIIAIVLFFYLQVQNKKSYNKELLTIINDRLVTYKVDTYEDLEYFLNLTNFDEMKETNEYIWYNIETKQLETHKLSSMLDNVNLTPSIPEAFIEGYWFVGHKDDKFTDAIDNAREVETTEDVVEVLSDLNKKVRPAIKNFYNSTVIVSENSEAKIFNTTNEVSYGTVYHVTNVVFSDEVEEIKASTFVFNGEQITALETLVIPRQIESVEMNVLSKIYNLKTVVCKEDLVGLLSKQYTFEITSDFGKQSIVGSEIVNKYTVTLYDGNNNITDVLYVDENTNLDHLHNLEHYPVSINEFYVGKKSVGYMYFDGSSNKEFNLSTVNRNYELYPNQMKTKELEVAVYNSTNNTYYDTLEAAYAHVNGEETNLVLLKDYDFKNGHTIPENITVVVPLSKEDVVGNANGTSSSNIRIATDADCYMTVTLAEGSTLYINGNLVIGGTISYPGQYYNGHTSGAHAKMINDGMIVVNGQLNCYGFVKGNGEVIVNEEGRLYEPFIVTDFNGGSNVLALYTINQTPFSRYAVVNIDNKVTIYSGGYLYGYCNLYALSDFNKTNVALIGNETTPGLINLKAGGRVEITQDYTKTMFEDNKHNNVHNDIPQTIMKFYGGATFNSMALEIYGVRVDTAGVDFPLPYNYVIELYDGSYSTETHYKLLPGSKVVVGNAATLTINKNFYVFDGFADIVRTNKVYPSTATLTANNFSCDAELIVNGTLVINSNFGGYIQTTVDGAKVTVNSAAVLENEVVCGGATSVNSTMINDKTSRVLKAYVVSNGELLQLETSKEYVSSLDGNYKVLSYKYNIYTDEDIKVEEEKIIEIEETLLGSFKPVV